MFVLTLGKRKEAEFATFPAKNMQVAKYLLLAA